MKVKSVTYSCLKITKPYENERAEVTLELDPGDTVASAFSKARAIVDKQLGLAPDKSVYERAKKVVSQYEADESVDIP